MKRFGILISLICLVLIAPRVSIGANHQDSKGEYQKQIETKLDEFQKNLKELKSKADDLKEDAKKEFDEQMKELQKKQEAVNDKLKELKSEGAKTWKNLRVQMDEAMDELNKQVDKMMSRFRK